MRLVLSAAKSLNGIINVPGDKSISHRAVMLGALAQGVTEIKGFLKARDCQSTIRCFRGLGVRINVLQDNISVYGRGMNGLTEPENILNVGNSGTTMRLMSGILAAQDFTTTLTGDRSIRRRPMGRVIKPLVEMGAQVIGRNNNSLAPFTIRGGELKPITFNSPVSSAQVKSAVLLAGLFTPGWTEVIEPERSRNHTELMLSSFGARVESNGLCVRIKGGSKLHAQEVLVPGDISSAAFFIVAALIVPNSKIVIESVGLNPTRDGIVEVLKEMGARIRISDQRTVAGEVIGDIEAETSRLKGVTIGRDMIPRLIDEIPILAVAASFADGVTEIHDAAELKIKESNRLKTICEGLTKMGARIEELQDGLRINGGAKLKGAVCQSYSDHRIAMSLAIAALGAEGKTIIEDAEAIEVSFPYFHETLQSLMNTSTREV